MTCRDGSGLRPVTWPDLPVVAILDELRATLDARGAAVLVAPPGTGKTTLVPLALAGADGRVLVAEPRRLATRAAATRMAQLIGEPVGRGVGYAVRGERRSGAQTRVEVVTSGLLLRRLVADPELAGVSTIVLDECHERHLDADLLLSLLLDVREGLRPDLRLLATSATVATGALAAVLGDERGAAPVLTVAPRAFPVDTRYLPPARGERTEAVVARAVRAALSDGDGDVLVFLPGAAEIRRTTAALADLPGSGVDVAPLHGRLSAAEQDRALAAGTRRRVVLATAVAESSLTVAGVRAVVDAGLARVPRHDPRRGLSGLVTVRVSAAVATQRAGRAGREGPGRVYRCWAPGDRLVAFPDPEIRTADLTRLALELAVWGTPDGRGLRWWDPPPPGPLAAARDVLRALGAVDDAGITARGRRSAGLGLHPRLARALLDGAAAVGDRAAAEVVALLDDDTLAVDTDVDSCLRALRGGTAPGASRWRTETDRLRRALADHPSALSPAPTPPSPPGPSSAPAPAIRADSAHPPSVRARRDIRERADGARIRGGGGSALVVGLAHPERLARRRSPGSSALLMAGGTAVQSGGAGHPVHAGAEWLAVAVADRAPGDEHARIRLAAVLDEPTALTVGAALLVEADEVGWRDGDVVAEHVRRLGAIVLARRRLARPDPGAVRAALLVGLRAEGTGLLRWTEHARRLRDRLATLHRVFGAPWPDVSESALLGTPADAMVDTDGAPDRGRPDRSGRHAGALDAHGDPSPDGPGDPSWSAVLDGVRDRAGLARVDAAAILRGLLDWRETARLDELAPERLTVASGTRVTLDWSGERPVLAVRVQELFGTRTTPTVADGRLPVLVHLLSPAGRPAAVTGDLASFWTTGYPQVRAELRGRYPKHDWPTDPLAAVPTTRPRRT